MKPSGTSQIAGRLLLACTQSSVSQLFQQSSHWVPALQCNTTSQNGVKALKIVDGHLYAVVSSIYNTSSPVIACGFEFLLDVCRIFRTLPARPGKPTCKTTSLLQRILYSATSSMYNFTKEGAHEQISKATLFPFMLLIALH